jgi:hypothetical protein
MPITLQDFVSKCSRVTALEEQTYQEQSFNNMSSSLDMFYKPDAVGL